jgi:hypothetical protein
MTGLAWLDKSPVCSSGLFETRGVLIKSLKVISQRI